ncbi:glucose-6-phosphate exchanger SLC37A4-like isoform X1 [Tachypleus tridentatus]|uniref:glucose-6-phosphate exchanger SLC37A4-like isoform X1 n=2 Tax=Tachypleus tridentatus TaxID=6853 RepID=UPI003FCF64AD
MEKKLKSYQLIIFTTMFIGYACYAYNRKSVSFAMPKLMEEGLSKNEAGLIASSQNMAYAISKFLGGILSDRISSKLLFSSGLVLSGIATLGFSGSGSLLAFASLWFVNGFAQGAGWPSCAKVLRKWYSPEQFGTWWSMLSASANISGGVSPFISAFFIVNYGWRFSLVIAGTISIILGSISAFTIVNSPSEVGLQSGVEVDEKKKDGTDRQNQTATFVDLLRSPFLWLVSFSYMVVFCAKTSAVDWGQLFLMEDRGHSQYVGSAFTSSVESGGFFGGVVAGYLTDWVLKQSMKQGKRGRGNLRMPVAIAFMIGVMICLHLLQFFVSATSSKFWITSIGFVLGACLYGPIAIFGVVATESAPSHLSGSCHAIVALAANVGAITSGLPFSYIAKHYNWEAIFFLLEIIAGITAAIMFLTRNLSSAIGHVKQN